MVEKQSSGYTAHVVSALSDQDLTSLADIVVTLVANGHGLGFSYPLDPDAAKCFFQSRLSSKDIIFLVARDPHNTIVGTAQLELATQENAQHRAVLGKLMTRSEMHGKGIGTLLLKAADDAAREAGRTLLVLRTRSRNDAARLYRKCGWVEVGDVPDFTRSAEGELLATKIFYKSLD
ncbi:acyl-CoA N-acyltransferase [Powellomyces hirtus]|nr:acyl-CoA N-acyltransferase [Powellomyces hirtus]